MSCGFYFTSREIAVAQNTFDARAFGLFAPITSQGITRFMIWVTFFGSRSFLVPTYILLVAYYWFWKKEIKLSVAIAAISLLGNQLLYLVQDFFHRQRPPAPLIQNVIGFSFPSGHAFDAYMFFGIFSFLLWRTMLRRQWKIILPIAFFLLAAVIAVTRIYLHVHYASDVAGGFFLSIMWLIFSLSVLKRILKSE